MKICSVIVGIQHYNGVEDVEKDSEVVLVFDEPNRYSESTIVVKNEKGLDELAFKDREVCDEYISIISKIWPEWVSDEDRVVMQFLADMCKSMSVAGYLTIDDLYTLSEREVINRFITTQDEYLSKCFKEFQKASVVHRSEEYVDGTYCVNVTSKTRYVDPLVLTDDGIFRISQISENARNLIQQYLDLKKGGYYTYFDFDFKPYDGKQRLRDEKNMQ